MKLYKYLSPERVDVLEQSLIRFTPAALFNDPFDSAFAIDVLEEHVTDWVDDRIQHIVEDLYAKNSEVADRDELLEMADRHRAKTIEQQIRMRRSFTEQVRPLVHTMFAESLGVLSLTEVPDNLLMWAHYAAHHRGFLVGFDADHQWFKQMRPEDSSGRSALRRVSYTRERPVGELSKFNIETMLLTKSLDWQYEREWRAIRGLDAAADVVHLSTEEVHLFPFPASAVSTVILGLRTTVELADRVRRVLSRFVYSHVELLKTELNPREFAVQLMRQS